MCQFYCTNSFHLEFSKLIKKPKAGYGSLPKDIHNYFSDDLYGKSEYVLLSPVNIQTSNDSNYILKKSRFRNSKQKLSDKDGFRIWFLYLKADKKVILLSVYPKRGKYAKDDLTDNEENKLITDYKAEKDCLISVSLMDGVMAIKS